jgi:hypothetical protein
MVRKRLLFALLLGFALLMGSVFAAECPTLTQPTKRKATVAKGKTTAKVTKRKTTRRRTKARVARAKPACPAPTVAKAPKIDPKAVEVLKQMSDYLQSLDRFAVRTEGNREVVFPSGLTVDSLCATDLKVERPNHLRADIVSAKRNVQVYYDGQNVKLFSPEQKLWAEWPAPGTIGEALARAQKQYALDLPATDFLGKDAYQTMVGKASVGAYVGRSLVRGQMAHKLAFRGKDVDWQVWVKEGEQPLPLRLVIVDRAVSGSPRYEITLTDWDTAPQFDETVFNFTPPEGASRITAAEVKTRAQKLAKR